MATDMSRPAALPAAAGDSRPIKSTHLWSTVRTGNTRGSENTSSNLRHVLYATHNTHDFYNCMSFPPFAHFITYFFG